MDGVGWRDAAFGNAVHYAYKPTLNYLAKHHPFTTLKAHGKAVGLPSDSDIGNSEVGHNALGAGRIFDQGAKLVQNAITSQSLFRGQVWTDLLGFVKKQQGCLHFIGLLSDGNVHSHEEHLYAMLRTAAAQGCKKLRVHALLDGRDVGEKSAEIYVQRLEKCLADLQQAGIDAKVASGGGRMRITMDRYEADWAMVERGWKTHVLGQAPNHFATLSAAIAHYRGDAALTDQYLPEFVIDEGKGPVGTITDGDGVVFFNFRGDRAIEISKAFTETEFSHFHRERLPKVYYAGMMQYDGDLKLPEHFLVAPPVIENTLSEYLLSLKVRQLACSETQKFGHVTYFWNGNRSGYLDKNLETYIEIPSEDPLLFAERPWMKAQEITAATVREMQKNSFTFGRINFANGDMVGHTGNFDAAVNAVSTVDLMLGKLLEAAKKYGYQVLITADHGNADEMFDAKESDFKDWRPDLSLDRPRPKTSHTLAPVPLCLFHPSGKAPALAANIDADHRTLGNIANTCLDLLGLPRQKDFLPSLLTGKN